MNTRGKMFTLTPCHPIRQHDDLVAILNHLVKLQKYNDIVNMCVNNKSLTLWSVWKVSVVHYVALAVMLLH